MRLLIIAAFLAVFNLDLNAEGVLAGLGNAPAAVPVPEAPPPTRVPLLESPPAKSDPCYLKENGCKKISGLYIVRNKKWDLKYAGNCETIIPRQTMPSISNIVKTKMCKAIKDKNLGPRPQSDIAQICRDVHAGFKPSALEQLWGPVNIKGALSASESDCSRVGDKASWFTDLVEIEYLESGEIHSGGETVAVIVEKLSGDSSYKIYNGSAQNFYNVQLEVTCRNYGNVWKNETMSIRVDMPSLQSQSSDVSVSVGASFGHLGTGSSMGSSFSTPYGEWRELGIKGLLCGSRIDKEDKPEDE